MSTMSFTRQLGAESGVQLNPLRDQSELPGSSNSDQIFGIMMRATRGRIDKPFAVDRSNVIQKLGKGEQIRVNMLNEAWVHVVEALNNGAYEAVVQRLVTENASIKWVVARLATVSVPNPNTSVKEDRETLAFTVEADFPTDQFLFAVKHLDCFNDGIVIEAHCEENRVGGVNKPTNLLHIRISDKDGTLLHHFYGSLDQNAKDDVGNSLYLPDVALATSDSVIIEVGAVPPGSPPVMLPTKWNAATPVDPTTLSTFYGYDNTGRHAWVKSKDSVTGNPQLICFDEGSLDFNPIDYENAKVKLQKTPLQYAYISSGGSKNSSLLAKLSDLAFATNRQLRFDIPGELNVDQAIAFVEQINIGSAEAAHLCHAFWAPLKTDDPTGVNPKGHLGVATLNIAYACARNAQTNLKGFAPKNYPIAGREWPVRRSRITQLIDLSDQELNKLAKAKINPVVHESYTGGGRYVFRDSLTCAMVDVSLKKLIAVVDMSTSIDEAVTKFGKDILQLPMTVAVKKMSDFLRDLFEGAQASGWIIPSTAQEMGGAAFKFEVKPNAARPYERMDVSYWLRYDGTLRQVFVNQILSR